MKMSDWVLADIIGSTGVALLLGAFGLNLIGLLDQKKALYLCVNMIGAGLAMLASWLIDYMPFVLLEGVWCGVSLFALVKSFWSSRSKSISN